MAEEQALTVAMSEAEKLVAFLAEATGRVVYLGRQGHKDEWFAGVQQDPVVEVAAGNPLGAVTSLWTQLYSDALSERSEAMSRAIKAKALVEALEKEPGDG